MREFNSELERLQADVLRMRKLKAALKSLCGEEEILAAEETALAKMRDKEQRDVDAMSRVSLTSIFSAIRGNKDEKLAHEELEARAAALKYDMAVRRLEAVRTRIKQTRDKLAALGGCERRFSDAVNAKLSELRQSDSEVGEKICRVEERIAYLSGQQRETQEAISVGKSAANQILSIQRSLDSAEDWGVFDLLGGGFVSTMAKHSHLDDAQAQVEHLQQLLSRFRTELSDIQVNADLRIHIDGFLRFADYFFDDLFSDWAVLNRIDESRVQVTNTGEQVQSLLRHLNQIRENIDSETLSLRHELTQLATNTR